MKRIAVVVALIALAVPCVVAQGEKPDVEVDPDAKLMSLYDTPGRAWSYRIITWTRGESPYVETERVEVNSVEDGKATVSSSTSDDWGNSSSSTRNVKLSEPTDALRKLAGKDLPVETLDMGFRKFECRKIVTNTEAGEHIQWISTEFHPLIVKETRFESPDYVIRKLTSFNEGKADPWLLYRKVGRSWTVRTTVETDGEPAISYYRNRITTVDGEEATFVMELMDKDRKPMEGIEPMETTLKMVAPAGGASVDAAPVPKIESKECEVGTFECYFIEVGGTKSWSSVRWPGLMVKMEADKVTSELVEFDLGHDMHEFYRTAGNSYSVKTTTKVAGFNMTQTMKYEVTKVDGRNSTWTLKSIDQNGRVTSSTSMTHTLPEEQEEGEDPEPAMPYSGQVEELVHTPAGSFPGIRTESGDMVSWMWNGLIIRMEMKTDDVEMVQELTELNIQ